MYIRSRTVSIADLPYSYVAYRGAVPQPPRGYETLAKAIQTALESLVSEEEYPASITGPSGVAWESAGPFEDEDNLLELARKHGIVVTRIELQPPPSS